MTVTTACHIHSRWSYDGSWRLEALADEFSDRGYRALLMTEHDRGFTDERFELYRQACAAASSARLLLVPGIEYSDAHNLVHILTWGELPFLGEGRPTAELLADVANAGGVAVLAHPARREAWKSWQPGWADQLLGVEIWNRKTDGWAPSATAAKFLGHGGLLPFVGMDFHDQRQMFPLAMELQCHANVSERSVVSALHSRQCRPLAFGQPLASATHGWLGRALRSFECCRRKAAATRRWFRRTQTA